MNLTELGVSPEDECLYRQLLEAPASVLPSLTESAVGRLVTTGLATLDSQGNVTAVPPQQTLERLAQRRIDEILGDLQRVFAAKTGLDGSPSGPEAIYGEPAVNDRIMEELWLRPAEEVRSVKGPVPVKPPVRGENLQRATLFRLRQGVRYRTIVHRNQLDFPERAAYYRQMHHAGDICRVTNDRIQPMKLLDRTRAFIPITEDDAGAGAFLLDDPTTVSTLVDLFDRVWDAAVDLHRHINVLPSEADRQILAMLQQTPKDEVAARQLNMSVRTFRRHVSELMTRTGAANRFQLALISKEQGWL